MDANVAKDPIWSILDHQSRSMRWLAARVDYSVSYVKQIKYGQAEVQDEFKRRCSRALDLPIDVLFCDSSVQPPVWTEPVHA